MRRCEVRDCGRVGYPEAFAMQRELVEKRKRGEIPDQLLFVEHPHVITLGRNGHTENLLASEPVLARAGVGFYETDRGGDITYHGPGQIVGYPIFDLREWKRDVVAYVRAMEQAIIDALARFRHRGRSRARRHGSVDARRKDLRDRRAHQPVGDISWFRAESRNRSELFSIHSPVWTH